MNLVQNKKGQALGLDTVKAVMLAFLVVGVIAITILVTGFNLTETYDNIDTQTTNLLNATTSGICNATTCTVDGITEANYRNCALTVTAAVNRTDGVPIEVGNWTVSGCIINATDSDAVGHDLWNVTGSYSYNPRNAANIHSNVSEGITDFFGNTGTIFAILIVVVIILAISIIIFAVQRFGGSGGL